MRFCEFLKEIRAKNNLTVQGMSDITGIPKRTIDKHIYGSRIPQPKVFVRYFPIFKLSKEFEGQSLSYMRDYFIDEERIYKSFEEENDEEA